MGDRKIICDVNTSVSTSCMIIMKMVMVVDTSCMMACQVWVPRFFERNSNKTAWGANHNGERCCGMSHFGFGVGANQELAEMRYHNRVPVLLRLALLHDSDSSVCAHDTRDLGLRPSVRTVECA